jgi:endonuclease-8
VAEGDTIVRAGRRIWSAVGGEALAVSAPSPRGRAAGVQSLDGLVLDAVETKGKNLMLRFGELTLHSHLGMSGSWHVYRAGGRWRKPAGAAWAVLRGAQSEAVQFGGPTLRVLSPAAARRELERLGPDILAPGLELGEAVASVRRAPDRELGEALLDQGLVAGIGNIFKSEACFAARLDPWLTVGARSPEQIESVHGAARALMERSVLDGRPPGAVYNSAGRRCPACGEPIESRGQGDANRTTYWCPRCQSG